MGKLSRHTLTITYETGGTNIKLLHKDGIHTLSAICMTIEEAHAIASALSELVTIAKQKIPSEYRRTVEIL